MPSVEVHKANNIFNPNVALAVMVQLAITKPLVLQALRIGAPIDLLLPMLMRLRKQLR